MPIEASHPSEPLGITEILDALGIGCDDAGEQSVPYLAIPGNSGPRWLIPAHSQIASQVLSSWRPYSLSGQAKWMAIRMAARTGVLQLSKSVTGSAISRAASLRWFERCMIQSWNGEIVILVGNPSPSRKLIVFLLDDEHRIAAVLKSGLTVAGGVKILYEAEVLSKLKGYSWAPNVLSIHPDLQAAAQDYVHGSLADRHFRPQYLKLLCQFPQSGGSKNLVDLAQRCSNALSPFREAFDRIAPDLLNRSLFCLDLNLNLPTLLVHGDFAPWNIRITPQSVLVLVDWESADFSGLPGHDLLHFLFSNDRLFGSKHGASPALRARPLGTQYLKQMDLNAELWPQLAIAYLLQRLQADCAQGDSVLYGLRQLAAIVDFLRSATGSQ